MPRYLLPILLVSLALVVAACSDDDHPQAPEPQPYTGWDQDSPSIGFASAGFTIPDRDAAGFIQLLWDGTLRVDRWDELPARVHEARITDAELATVAELAREPRLLALLRGEIEGACPGGLNDYYEFLHSYDGDEELSLATVTCDEPVIAALRAELHRLEDVYLPAD